MSDDLNDASGINTSTLTMADRLRAMSHTAVRPDLFHVGISWRSADWWARFTGTGNYDAKAKLLFKPGWFVTDPNGHVLAERRFTTERTDEGRS